MIESIIKPLKPKGKGWIQSEVPEEITGSGFPIACWLHRQQSLIVLSAVEVARDKDNINRGPEYHLSMSKYPRARCSRNEARYVLKVFGIPEAEEDNHVPHGFVRNFWRPVADKFVGLECACKATEPAMKEDKGEFVWRE